MSVNKVIIIGHVGQDPEVRYTGNASSGAKVAQLRVATTEKYKDKEGKVQEVTEWHSVVLWRSLADVVEKYVKKGTQVYVEGKLQTRSWEDNAGAKKYATDIVAQSLQLLGKREADPAVAGAREMANRQTVQSTPIPAVGPSDNPEDDLPF